jgi:hypothetical protein
MELLIPYICHSCGKTDEAKFVYAGPHIKQVCNQCGRYVKFVSKGFIPDPRETKLKIWSITTDIETINSAKKSCIFVEGLTGVDLKMVYWRLYLRLRDMRPDLTLQHTTTL